MNTRSGISKYSYDFFELVLKEKGYIFLNSEEGMTTILTRVSSRDHVHIEIGIFQEKELEILMAMLNANYKNIAVTLHDPPLFKYPFVVFQNPLLNKISKFYDVYLNRFRQSKKYIEKIKYLYVLTHRGVKEIKSTYKTDNVYYLPHVIDEREIKVQQPANNNFVYFGFIGKNKGIEYALKLHQQLLQFFPEINFYIMGEAIGKNIEYYNYLKSTYTKNIHYLGYVSEEVLDDVFNMAGFSIVPFISYKFYTPFSGSLLTVMKYGKIPFTNNVNAVSELIEDAGNGFFLSGKIEEDVRMVSGVINSKALANEVSQHIYTYLAANHTAQNINKYLLN
ncbi:MAG: glycosyltransferase [Ferruginibacter sp.]